MLHLRAYAVEFLGIFLLCASPSLHSATIPPCALGFPCTCKDRHTVKSGIILSPAMESTIKKTIRPHWELALKAFAVTGAACKGGHVDSVIWFRRHEGWSVLEPTGQRRQAIHLLQGRRRLEEHHQVYCEFLHYMRGPPWAFLLAPSTSMQLSTNQCKRYSRHPPLVGGWIQVTAWW